MPWPLSRSAALLPYRVEQLHKMYAKDYVKFFRERKLSVKDVFKLTEEGKRDEAKALMKALMEVADNEPDEIIQETGRPAIRKRRGKFVVPDEAGGIHLNALSDFLGPAHASPMEFENQRRLA